MSEQRRDVVIVGRACRLPGSSSVEELWANLLDGRCSVTEIPEDRWPKAKHGHPRPKEPGRAYTWASGTLDDIWSFDPTVFGISPREAEQMDPQQRLMLEVTWEALEDAGLARSDLAGKDVGVFVGASSPEYTVIRNSDAAGGDAYTATGSAVSIISNRISHAFDFRGPSFTVDTACSSSLVAFHQAMDALRSGRIDTAIVGGINLLLSPFGFVAFSQASMLSPTGLCRTFDAGADGYVRSEGAVALVLKTADSAARDGCRPYVRVAASGINSDGRTNGIALPSRFSQAQLLRQVYAEAAVEPDEVAFIEAHGTGTRVGDPIEAGTIGEVLGQGRKTPLLVGSIKSNIGHLEPASGLAGILKAMLALEHDTLPPTINFSEPNPDIPFGELNLEVCARPAALPRGDRPRYAGVNSFGFGGTNAHVVIGDMPRTGGRIPRYNGTVEHFALSGGCRAAVRDLARDYSTRLASLSSERVGQVAAAAIHRRELLPERVVVDWKSPRDLVRKLEAIADKTDDVPGVTWGTATETDAPVAFVFSGNGGQWPGMGRAAYSGNRAFREALDEVDALFDEMFGWSVTEALLAEDLEQRLHYTHVAQPLIFAIQIATARALAAVGITPAVVLGHSVGEIAAAAVAGGLSLRDAVRVIHARSAHQELARDAGRMAVVVASAEQIETLVSSVADVEVAAFNSPRTYTVAGPTDEIKKLGTLARKQRIVFRKLDLDYPFHCALVDCVRDPLLRDLKGLRTAENRIPFVSTVTGDALDGQELDENYWWRNVREPVRFAGALDAAAALGARVFMEIGPRSVLLSSMTETLDATSLPFAVLGVLEKREEPEEGDPVRPAAIQAFARGAAADLEKLFGPEPAGPVALPLYKWQRRDFRIVTTPEAVAFTLDTRWHRLIGARATSDGVEWTGLLDTTSHPELADHVVGGQPILPAAAFIEIALAAARDWYGTENTALLDLEISQPLALEADRAKEVRARLSPVTNTLEILSRPRLARAGWTLHAVAKLTEGSSDPIVVPPPIADGQDADPAAIYRAADAVGLHYGPAFRLLGGVRRAGASRIELDLLPSTPAGRYRIDPARLDACFHGLFALLSTLGAERRGTAYIPVRFGHIRVRPGGMPVRAVIEVTRADERAIVAAFTLLDEEGAAVASLDEARFQAARVQRVLSLDEKALAVRRLPIDARALGKGGVSATVADLVRSAGELRLLAEADAEDGPEQLLLEGWATAAAYEIAGRLATDGEIADGDLAAMAPERARWVANLLHSLEQSGLAASGDDGWRLLPSGSLPASPVILRTLTDEYPERATEILVASALAAASGSDDAALPVGAAEAFELGGVSIRAASEAVARLLSETSLLRSVDGSVTVLQIGYGPLSHRLQDLAEETGARLTVLETSARRLERAKLALGGRAGIVLTDDSASLAAASFDVICSAERLHRFVADGRGGQLGRLLAPGGLLTAIEPAPSQFRDVVLGLQDGWFEGAAGFPVGPLLDSEGWRQGLSDLGLSDIEIRPVSAGTEIATLIVAGAPAGGAILQPAERSIRIHASSDAQSRKVATRLDALLAIDGHQVETEPDGVSLGRSPEPADITLFVVASPAGADPAGSLRDICLDLKACAESGDGENGELWVVATAASEAVVAGVLSFSRTLANEMPGLKVRRISSEPGVSADQVVEAVRRLAGHPQTETDISVGPAVLTVLRVEPLRDDAGIEPLGKSLAARLERGSAGGLSGLAWVGIDRQAPAAGEVEIAVEASGLNFRDVMWAMSLLPDDILEDGFAGPTLGLECAGRVSRVGRGVTGFKAGDRVLAFAPSAFSSHVSVPQNVVSLIPDALGTEAAATVPVAFLTAWYGLVTLANLKAGERVLIHGAAGGVGLAAVQIAQHVGAEIVATAGAPEKRELLRTLGVSHVLNSRSSTFADDLRRLFPDGVDVLLNSLAGEAMERGLSVLKPFGRFIELGKRDYVGNTRIGLRPFRRNLSYFGVDVDQLLSDRDRASSVFAEVIALFGSGALRALPYRVFPAAETVDAFRLMQQSGHVGKIVLRPPSRVARHPSPAPFGFDPERTHLVTGAFGGFGVELARWLADQGARHLVLTGRNGAASETAKALLIELHERGVAVRVAACDVTDRDALASLLADVRRTMPPLAGIMHAAMVLEDSLLANLTGEQLERVLAPKVSGARHLDELTDGDELDYFVLFSSITTVVGNPGQAAYVAANGYLEGVARARTARGLPGLALAWGAISDVGVLARQRGLAETLAKRVGVKAMPAREALDLMAQALTRTAAGRTEPVMAIGSLDWSAAKRLPALSSPTYAALVREGGAADAGERDTIDLRTLVATGDGEAVRRQVAGVIVEEIAAVLRVPKQDVSQSKRLAEIGLDSLMAIELATALQERFELGSPPTGSVGTLTVPGLAEHLISFVHSGVPDDEARVSQALVERHGSGEIDASLIAPIIDAATTRAQDRQGVL